MPRIQKSHNVLPGQLTLFPKITDIDGEVVPKVFPEVINMTSELLSNCYYLGTDLPEKIMTSLNFLQADKFNFRDSDINLIVRLLGMLPNLSTSNMNDLNTLPPTITFVVDLNDINGFYQKGRTIENLWQFVTRRIVFKHAIMTKQDGKTPETWITLGHGLSRIVDENGNETSKVALYLRTSCMYYIYYTGKDMNGQIIGAGFVPVKKTLQLKGKNIGVKKLFLWVMEGYAPNQKEQRVKIGPFYENMAIPASNRKLSIVKKRILDPFVDLCRENLDVHMEVSFRDAAGNPVSYEARRGPGANNIEWICFIRHPEATETGRRLEYVTRWIRWAADGSDDLREDIWQYLDRKEHIDYLFGEFKKLEDKVGRNAMEKQKAAVCGRKMMREFMALEKKEDINPMK